MSEIDTKSRAITDSENKIIRLNEDLEKKDYQIKDMDQVFNTLRLKNEAYAAEIKGLESEKSHLELSLSENRILKDQYYEKSETVQKKYQELFDRFNFIQKDIVAIDELKRDRDERIGQLRNELDEVSTKYDELSKANSALAVTHKHCKEELDELKNEHSALVDNLTVSNKMRQEKEEALSKLEVEFDQIQQKHEASLESIQQLKKEVDKYYERLV